MGSVHEMVVKLAETVTGASAEENSLLEPLCAASEEMWEKRLRKGLAPADCGSAFACAAAFSAAASLAAGNGGGGTASFTAGDVSVKSAAASDAAAFAAAMYEQAERLMAPYVEQDNFAFYGVKG